MDERLNQYVNVDKREELSKLLNYMLPSDRQALTTQILEACNNAKEQGFVEGLATRL